MAIRDASERTFKNTFAPRVENEYLSVHDVILGLKTTMLRSTDLPLEVREAVTAELRRRPETGARADPQIDGADRSGAGSGS